MQRFKQVAKQQVSKIPMLHNLLWRSKMRLNNSNSSVKIVTFQDATTYILTWLKTLPNDYDLVIGIPRSGLWVASTIALKLGKPLSTPTAYVRGETWQSLHIQKRDVHSVLLVEDDVLYGKQILKAKQQLQQFQPSLKVTTASLFATSNGRKLVDYCYQIRNPPLLYEWTLLTNLASMGKLAVDMDGVLCEECPPNIDNNEATYIDWLQNAKPYMIPQYPVEAVITSRLEKYREHTEAWLKKHGVQYKQLHMLNVPSKRDRNLETIIQHKATALKVVQPFWYWESNQIEAQAIKTKTHIPVLCTATLRLLL